jgi:hypothetical protein
MGPYLYIKRRAGDESAAASGPPPNFQLNRNKGPMLCQLLVCLVTGDLESLANEEWPVSYSIIKVLEVEHAESATGRAIRISGY